MNKKSIAFLVVFIFYIFLLKGYFNLLFATIIFAYFTEVLIEVFTKLKEKIVKNIEDNLTKKNLLISFVKEMKIGILFVYVFYFLFFLIFIFGVFIPVMNQVLVVIKEGIAKVPEVIKNLRFWIENLSGKTNLPLEQNVYEIIGNLSKWLDI
ncbi:MAG: hypothetical protein ACK4GR_03580, partial [bacterium]